jgi:hypothetical protein
MCDRQERSPKSEERLASESTLQPLVTPALQTCLVSVVKNWKIAENSPPPWPGPHPGLLRGLWTYPITTGKAGEISKCSI